MTFEYRESGDGYLVRLEYSEQRVESQPRVGEKVGNRGRKSKSSQSILDAVSDDPNVTIAHLAELCGISTRAVQKSIEVLKKGCY